MSAPNSRKWPRIAHQTIHVRGPAATIRISAGIHTQSQRLFRNEQAKQRRISRPSLMRRAGGNSRILSETAGSTEKSYPFLHFGQYARTGSDPMSARIVARDAGVSGRCRLRLELARQ